MCYRQHRCKLAVVLLQGDYSDVKFDFFQVIGCVIGSTNCESPRRDSFTVRFRSSGVDVVQLILGPSWWLSLMGRATLLMQLAHRPQKLMIGSLAVLAQQWVLLCAGAPLMEDWCQVSVSVANASTPNFKKSFEGSNADNQGQL